MNWHDLPMPTFWAGLTLVFGVVVTALVMLQVSKRYGPLQSAALNNLVKLYEKQIEGSNASLEMQKGHYEIEIKDLREERDKYRDKAHQLANDLGAENLKLKLHVQELELRPNFEQIETQQQNFYTEMSSTQKQMVVELKGIGSELHAHELGVADRMKPLMEATEKTANAVAELVTYLKPKARRHAN